MVLFKTILFGARRFCGKTFPFILSSQDNHRSSSIIALVGLAVFLSNFQTFCSTIYSKMSVNILL